MSTTKKSKKYAFGIVGAVLVAILVAYLAVFLFVNLSFYYATRWKYNVEDFPEYQEDFAQVAAFCSAFIQEERENDADAEEWFWVNTGLKYAGRSVDLEIDPDLQERIERIREAFPDPEATLDFIWCHEDGSVYFVASGQYYALAYCPFGKPVSVNGSDDGASCVSKKIVAHWYHVARKE